MSCAPLGHGSAQTTERYPGTKQDLVRDGSQRLRPVLEGRRPLTLDLYPPPAGMGGDKGAFIARYPFAVAARSP